MSAMFRVLRLALLAALLPCAAMAGGYGKSGSSLAIGTTPGTAFDGAQGLAAQTAATNAQGLANTLNTSFSTFSATLSNAALPGNTLQFGNLGGQPLVNVTQPINFSYTSGASSIQEMIDLRDNHSANTGSNLTEGLQVNTTGTSTGSGSNTAGFFEATGHSSNPNNDAIAAWTQVNISPGAQDSPWSMLYQTRDQTGLNSGYNEAAIATTGVTWSGGVATVTLASADTLSVGTPVTLTGIVPSVYNGLYAVTGLPSSNSFTFALANGGTNPGAATTQGTLAAISAPKGTLIQELDDTASLADDNINNSNWWGLGNRVGSLYVFGINQQASPLATSAEFAAAIKLTENTGNTTVDCAICFGTGGAATGFIGYDGFDTMNAVVPSGDTNPFNALLMPSGQVIELAGDLKGGSIAAAPQRAFSYNKTTGCMVYSISGSPAFSACDSNLFTAYYNALISGNLTLGGWMAKTVSPSVAAAGTTLATATVLASSNNKVSSGASGAGVALPSSAPVGTDLWVYNRTGNPIKIWPDSSSDTIESGTAGAAVTVVAGADEHFVRDTSTDWLQ